MYEYMVSRRAQCSDVNQAAAHGLYTATAVRQPRAKRPRIREGLVSQAQPKNKSYGI